LKIKTLSCIDGNFIFECLGVCLVYVCVSVLLRLRVSCEGY